MGSRDKISTVWALDIKYSLCGLFRQDFLLCGLSRKNVFCVGSRDKMLFYYLFYIIYFILSDYNTYPRSSLRVGNIRFISCHLIPNDLFHFSPCILDIIILFVWDIFSIHDNGWVLIDVTNTVHDVPTLFLKNSLLPEKLFNKNILNIHMQFKIGNNFSR